MSQKNETPEVVEGTVVDETPKTTLWTKVKTGAAQHSGKIKVAAGVAIGAVGYAIVTHLSRKDSSDEIEVEDDFEGSDEETIEIQANEN